MDESVGDVLACCRISFEGTSKNQKSFLQVIAYTLKGRTLQNPRQMAFFAFSAKTAASITAQNDFSKNYLFWCLLWPQCATRKGAAGGSMVPPPPPPPALATASRIFGASIVDIIL